MRWQLEEKAPEIRVDPHYKIMIGSLYETVKDEYPFHEELPTATMPDEISGYMVQHRFRKGKDLWPLIQIGPGIVTLNDTEGYVWEDFKVRISYLIDKLFTVYPEPSKLRVSRLLLRYIDAISFDYSTGDIFNFLGEKMKINLNIHQGLFDGTGIVKKPLGIDMRLAFPSSTLRGQIHFRVARGKKEETDALILDTIFESVGEDAPKDAGEIVSWAERAHEITDDWFFKLIEGELLGRFK